MPILTDLHALTGPFRYRVTKADSLQGTELVTTVTIEIRDTSGPVTVLELAPEQAHGLALDILELTS